MLFFFFFFEISKVSSHCIIMFYSTDLKYELKEGPLFI